ncbi:MAG: TolC family protein, partial [Planctomycetota bacterium]|nr:TolC family protein [Planctomycetota bacterium]
TLDVAIGIAIANDAKLRKELAVVVQRSAELTQAGQLPNPTISGAFGIATDGLSGAPLVLRGMQGLSWIWTRPDKIASADATLKQSILTASHRAMELKRNVSVAYIKLSHAEAQMFFATELLQLAEARLEHEQNWFEIGEESALHIEEDKKQYGTIELLLDTVQEQTTNAYIELATLLGHPTHTTFILDDNRNQLDITLNDFQIEQLLTLAQSQRFDLLTSHAVVQQRTAQLGLASPPEITGTLALNESFNEREALMPGANITLQLDKDAKEAIADAKLEQSVAEHLHTMIAVQSEVQSSFNSLIHAISQKEIVQQTQVQPARVIVYNNQLLQREGEVSELQVLQSQLAYLNARMGLVEKEQALATAYYNLQFAVGGTFKTINKEGDK